MFSAHAECLRDVTRLYLILSSSAFFSSASLLSTVMIASCSSSVRWLRSIMAPPPGSLSGQMWNTLSSCRQLPAVRQSHIVTSCKATFSLTVPVFYSLVKAKVEWSDLLWNIQRNVLCSKVCVRGYYILWALFRVNRPQRVTEQTVFGRCFCEMSCKTLLIKPNETH